MENRSQSEPLVALLVNGLEVGGSEGQALLLAEALAGRGVRTAILSLAGGGPLVERCRTLGIPFDGDAPFSICGWRRRPACCAREGCCGGIPADGGGHVQQRIEPLCGVAEAPGESPGCFGSSATRVWTVRRRGERLAVRRADGCGECAFGGAFLSEALGVPSEKIALIPNAVRVSPVLSEPRRTWRRRFGVPPGRAAGLHGRQLAAAEGSRHAAARMGGAGAAINGASASGLAGRFDALADEVRRLMAEEQLDNCVHLAGCVDDVGGLLRDADFAVFSSRSEEKCPTGVGTDGRRQGRGSHRLPGVRLCLGDGMDEWLAPPGDACALADRLGRLLADRPLRDRLGYLNRERVGGFHRGRWPTGQWAKSRGLSRERAACRDDHRARQRRLLRSAAPPRAAGGGAWLARVDGPFRAAASARGSPAADAFVGAPVLSRDQSAWSQLRGDTHHGANCGASLVRMGGRGALYNLHGGFFNYLALPRLTALKPLPFGRCTTCGR